MVSGSNAGGNDKILIEGQTKDGRAYVVRPYRRLDRERVRWVCCETGFVGDPVEAVFEGREPFADLWSKYWTDHEPQNAFVAEVEGRVEGYIFGSLDTKKQESIWGKKILPSVARQMLSPVWWGSHINREFIAGTLRSYKLGQFKVPLQQIMTDYPAHLHTNIGDPGLRGQGIGGAMMRAYLTHVKSHDATGIHLGTTSHNRLAVPFYLHLGFEIIAKNHVTCYDHALDDPPLYLLYMAKSL